MVKIIRAVEFEDKVAIDRRRVIWRVFGAGTGREALDHRIRVRTVEIGDRVAVGPRFVENAVRGR